MLGDYALALERIHQDPEIMAGKPVIRGTRVPVDRVLGHLAAALDVSDVLRAFPHITLEDIRACLEYAQRELELTQRKRRSKTPQVA